MGHGINWFSSRDVCLELDRIIYEITIISVVSREIRILVLHRAVSRVVYPLDFLSISVKDVGSK